MLQQARLPRTKLDCVRSRFHQNRHRPRQVLDPGQEFRVVKDSVIHGHIEAFAVGGEEALKARFTRHVPSSVAQEPMIYCPFGGIIVPKIGDRQIEIVPDYEVIRSVIDNRGDYVAWFGAGTSVEAGVKTGRQICLDLRSELAAYAHPSDEDGWAHSELSWDDPKRRYSTCLKKYGSAAKRVKYFRQLIQGLQPCFSHHAVSLLMQAGYLKRTALTTNFDKLVEIAFAQQGDSECQAIRGDEEANYWRQEDDKCYVIKLHGDYDTHNLLNTNDETPRIPAQLNRIVLDSVKQRGMLVVGSSGYEESVIRLFSDMVDSEDPTVLSMGLYWGVNVGNLDGAVPDREQIEARVLEKLRGGSVSQELLDVMDILRRQGRHIQRAFFPVFGAGEFFLRLVELTENKAVIGKATRYLDYRMRLRRIFARGGLTEDAIKTRLRRLEDKQQDRRRNQDLIKRSRGLVRLWSARRAGASVSVEVVYGDISSRSFMSSQEPRDVRRAVVSPEDTLISAGGGVALALLKKAGQHQILNELSKFQRVRHKEVVVTSGGELPANYIFHAAATNLDCDGNSSVTACDVCETMQQALRMAMALEVRLLFLPLESPRGWKA